MAHPQELRDRAQQLADWWYSYFTYPCTFYYGTLAGYGYYGVICTSDGATLPFDAFFVESVLGEMPRHAGMNTLHNEVCRKMIMFQDSTAELPFAFKTVPDQDILPVLLSASVEEPTIIDRESTLHRVLVALWLARRSPPTARTNTSRSTGA